MTLVVLAAGEGKRIKPLVTTKALLPFLGKTMLEWVIDSTQALKPKNLIIVVNPKDKEIVTKLFPKAKLAVQVDPSGGMAGAVLAAKGLTVGPAVIVNGDDLIGEEVMGQFARQIKKTPAQAVFTGIKSNLTGAYFDLRGASPKVIEKPAVKPSEWFKIVLDYFPKIEDFIAALSSVKSSSDDVYEQALNQIPAAVLVKAEGEFKQLKYPHQVLDITEYLLAKFVKDKSLIDKTARIFPGATVIRSYIGPGVVVGNNALVRDSIVEAGSEIGFCTEVARSYVGPKSFCHTNYVGDSVVEGETNFGAGAVLANFRFDHKPIGETGRIKFGAVIGQGSQIGVNASLMPGSKVEAGGVVGPGAVWK